MIPQNQLIDRFTRFVNRIGRQIARHFLYFRQRQHSSSRCWRQGAVSQWDDGRTPPAIIGFCQRFRCTISTQGTTRASRSTRARYRTETAVVSNRRTINSSTMMPLSLWRFLAHYGARCFRAETLAVRVIPERIFPVPDFQAVWSFLFFSASARANYLLRVLPPEATREFARQHDESLRMCVSE